MKIRHGFVSNSSSSSFLIKFKDNTDTSKIPNGLRDKLNDLKEYLEEYDNETDNNHVKCLKQNIAETEQLIKDNWVQFWIDNNDYESVEDMIKIFKQVGCIEDHNVEDE